MNGASVRKGEETMPKKKNFLGGMQNYNPNTGEYEPALKGPNGESPSGFKSFKKAESGKSAFNEYNDKRTGKSSVDSAEQEKKENTEKSFNGSKRGKESTALIEQIKKNSPYNELLNKFKDGTLTEEETYGFDEIQTKIDTLSEISKADNEIDKAKEIIERSKATLKSAEYKELEQKINNGDATTQDQLKYLRPKDAKHIAEIVIENLNEDGEDESAKVDSTEETESFEEVNNKRIGKEQPKSEEPDTNSMSIKEFSNWTKKMLKEKGFDTKGISIRGKYAGYSDALDVRVKDPNIDIAKIEKLLSKHESYERGPDGDILQGGNRYITIQYDYDAFNEVKKEGKADAENLMKQADASNGSGIEVSKGVYLFKDGNRYFVNGDYEKTGGSRTVYSPEDLAVMKWKLKKFGRLN